MSNKHERNRQLSYIEAEGGRRQDEADKGLHPLSEFTAPRLLPATTVGTVPIVADEDLGRAVRVVCVNRAARKLLAAVAKRRTESEVVIWALAALG